MYAEKGIRLDEAMVLIMKALTIDPDNGAYVDSLGWVYYKQGRYSEALKTIQHAARLVGDDPVVLEHLGDAYCENKLWKEALEEWGKSLKLEPTNDAVKQKIEKLRIKLEIKPTAGSAEKAEKKDIVQEQRTQD
jgi:tetratricopeptide (TPR) repeat protein